MDMKEAMKRRHSVRQYRDEPIGEDLVRILNENITECNLEGDLHLQLVIDEPKAFGGMMARYGRFENVHNYIALVGGRDKTLEERVGYYGQRIVLLAQTLGLNTCWVGLHYKKIKGAFAVSEGEKLVAVIAIGYGRHRGLARKSKSVEKVSNVQDTSPEWFKRGVEAALLAPTAVNQQSFYLTLDSERAVVTRTAGIGFYTKTDLGIVKYQFELAAGKENFKWSDEL